MKNTHLYLVYFFLFSIFGCNEIRDITQSNSNSGAPENAPYLWKSNDLPRNLLVSTDFDFDEKTSINSMAEAWETIIFNQKNFFTTGQDTNELTDPEVNLQSLGEDGINGIYKFVHWPETLSGGALAVTQIFGSRINAGTSSEYVRIEHADILVNYAMYQFRLPGPVVPNTYDLETVILHELGHFLGLGHRNDDRSIMKPSIGTSTRMNNPGAIDAMDIASKYGITTNLNSTQMALSAEEVYRQKFKILDPSLPQPKIRILMELFPSGECVHKENGRIIERHFALKLK